VPLEGKVNCAGERPTVRKAQDMLSRFSLIVSLNGRGYPFVVFGVLLIVVLFQLFSGQILDLRWKVRITRNNRPRAYWIVIAMESAFVLGGLLLGYYTMSPAGQ
jgi:hypothetical protein